MYVCMYVCICVCVCVCVCVYMYIKTSIQFLPKAPQMHLATPESTTSS